MKLPLEIWVKKVNASKMRGMIKFVALKVAYGENGHYFSVTPSDLFKYHPEVKKLKNGDDPVLIYLV